MQADTPFPSHVPPHVPPTPANETARLARLHSYEVLDSLPEADFDDFTLLASRLLQVPIALISLVDEERQWFKSRVGLEVDATPRSVAFCAYAIHSTDLLVVEDALTDPRFAQSPLVLGEPHIRFYAGCPLVSPDGLVLGTLCIIDREPRALSPQDADTLRRLARQLMNLLELRRSGFAQEQAQQLLKRQTAELERLALVAEHTHNVVILGDTAGYITWVNAAFERVTGYTLNEAIGRKPGDLLQCADTSPQARRQLSAAVRERRHTRVRILNCGKRGNLYWMDIELQPLYGSHEEFIGFVAIETDITDLVTRQQHLDALIEAVPVGLVLHNGKQQVQRLNGAARQILAGSPTHEATDLTSQLNELLNHMLPQQPRGPQKLVAVNNAAAQPRWLDVRVAALPNAPGAPADSILVFSDHTEQVHAGNYIELAAQTADIGYWTWNLQDDRLELSASWLQRLHLPPGPQITTHLVHPDDQGPARQEVMKVLRGEQPTFRFEERLRTGDGQWRWVLCGGAVIQRDAQGRVTRLAGIHLDIDAQKRVEQALQKAATTDPLTGLPNRLVMLDRLNRALTAARRHGQCGALLYLDLDHFKRINDSYGHGAGDELLKTVACRISGQLREEDTLSRMGGDEMMVLLPQLGTSLAIARQHAQGVAHKLIQVLEAPLLLEGRPVVVGASVGVTLFPKTDLENAEDLVREADTAMYGAKGDTRGTVRFYEAQMQQAATSRLQLDNDLREALEQDAFELFMQGKWAPGGQLVGGELLLRWKHPVRGWVSPSDFIPVAEESELIQHIGHRVLKEAVHIAATVRRVAPEFVVSVNISPKQFRRDEFIHDLRQLVAQAGLPPEALMLEITEGVLLQEQLARSVVALSEEGYRFSLDDFGTGYSSLAYLKRLPVHELKIDKAFVRDIETDPDDAVLVQAILSIARRFNIQTVAEGIETQAQRDFLATHGCAVLQGYLFDRPQPWRSFVREFVGG